MNNIKRRFIQDKYKEKGVATLLIVTILSIVFISLSIALARSNLVNFQSLETLKNSRKSYYFAESGIEDTLIQLEENLSYTGNPSGEVTPIGTYYSEITNIGDDYTLNSYVMFGETKRIINMEITITYDIPEVTTKTVYMSDFFFIYGDGARVRGDVWTNDDFDIIEHGVIEGNISSAGRGSFFVNWVWDGILGGNPGLQGGEVIDNPETTGTVEGNIEAADAVKVSGPTAYVQGDVTSNRYVWEIFGGTIDGTVTEYADLVFNEIPVPSFDFDFYKQQAITQGTYYTNDSSFENYVESLDDGNERRLPSDLYYVENGTVQIVAGNPVYLDGILITEDSLYIYTEWYQNAQGNLPALVSGRSIHIENPWNWGIWDYDWAGPVRINGIVFAERDAELFREFNDEDIILEGALWAGDDIYIKKHSYVHYNIDPKAIQGFDFVTGITDLQVNIWEEEL